MKSRTIRLQLEGLAGELPLPEVDTEHVYVSADDAITFANADSISQPESFWKALAAPLLAGSPPSLAPPPFLPPPPSQSKLWSKSRCY